MYEKQSLMIGIHVLTKLVQQFFIDIACFNLADRLYNCSKLIIYSRVVQLLHSCGPLFKIIRVCGPQSAKNSYFRSKIRCSLKKKKKGLHLESVSKIPILAQNHSVLQKKITAAASDRQDLCKIDMRHAAREPVVGPRCYRRLPLLMIDKT